MSGDDVSADWCCQLLSTTYQAKRRMIRSLSRVFKLQDRVDLVLFWWDRLNESAGSGVKVGCAGSCACMVIDVQDVPGSGIAKSEG